MTKSGKTPAAPSSLRVSGQKGRPQARPASIYSSSAPSTSARPMARSERPSAQSPAPRPASQMADPTPSTTRPQARPTSSAVDVANRLRRARQERINARRNRD